MKAAAGIFVFVFLTFLDTAKTQDGSAKIWSDNDCPNVGKVTDCQEAECCKAACTKDAKCTAVNFKPGDCILRGCKCTGLVPPTWVKPPHKGTVWMVLWMEVKNC